MRSDIRAFPSQRFYGGRLSDGENVLCDGYRSTVDFHGKNPYLFLQVAGHEQKSASGSFYNTEEATAVLRILLSMKKSLTDTPPHDDGWLSPDRIRIITFYRGQVEALRRLLRRHGLGAATVATVDSSQGCEA